MNLSLLTTLTFLPLAGAILILLIGSGDEETAARNAKRTALWTSLVTLAVSLVVLSNFDWNQPGFQMVEESSWLSGIVKYRMGIDGISLGLILLTTLLMPICILMSWTAIKERVKDFMVAFLILETLVLGVFLCAGYGAFLSFL
jgi:NADH:ubiquinone oxidoreductase subunit 4 (chain M)